MMRFLLLLLPALIACAAPSAPLPARPAEAAAVPPPADPGVMLRTGIEALRSGDLETARERLEAAQVNLPLLADHATAHLAKIAELRGKDSEASGFWRQLIEDGGDSVWRGPAALALARRALDSNDATEARRLLRLARTSALLRPERAAALWIEAQVTRLDGSLAEARRLRDRVRDLYPGLPQAQDAREEAWKERSAALASKRDAVVEIERWLSELRPDRAVILAREARARFPGPRDQPSLAWLEAEALRKSGRLEASEATLGEIRSRYPESREAAEALYRLALNAWNRDDDDDARKLFGEYVHRHPRGPQAAESLYAIGRIHTTAGRRREAVAAFEKLIRTYPRADLVGEARWRIGWAHYRSGRFLEAGRAFGRASRDAAWRTSALYWQARSRERHGLDASVQYHDLIRSAPDDYYAWMAGRRTGRPVVVPTAPPPETFGHLPPDGGDLHLRRMNVLSRLGLHDLARRELEPVSESLPPRARLDAWAAVGGYREALREAYDESGCRPAHPLAAYCFPRAFWTTVERESRRHGIDPWLVLSLMRQESLFDPEALSSANARGLMQLLPETAERTARNLGRGGVEPASLFAPEDNIALGVAHLGELSSKYEGSTVRVLAAYNAGANAVAKWDARFPGADDDEFVDTISYRETRDYVRKVLRHRLIYESMYGTLSRSDTDRAG